MEHHCETLHTCIGIVAEFDPFHLGHRWLIQQARQALPGHGVICVMSGSFTQRGSAASTDKFARCEMALRSGADLVLELPVLWAAASAETFARGGIQCLLDTGVVDTIAFGSEDGTLSRLLPTAQALDSPQFLPLLQEGLGRGLSYAAARQRAVEALVGDAGQCLSTANNNLGVEYLRALRHWGRADVQALTFPRQGAEHDSTRTDGPFVSASLLRQWMAQGDWDRLAPVLPASSLSLLRVQRDLGRCPARLDRCELAVLARLRAMEETELARLPDCGDGLERRLARAARESVTLAEFYDRAKTRRYPEARIRRTALWAFLGLTADRRPERVPYLRVLGCTGRGRAILRDMKQTAALPQLIRPGQARRLDETGQRVFRLEARAADLWQLCLPGADQRRGGQEWLRTPVILD